MRICALLLLLAAVAGAVLGRGAPLAGVPQAPDTLDDPLSLDPDVGKGMALVNERGFELEVPSSMPFPPLRTLAAQLLLCPGWQDHYVQTEDGYILHLFRIPLRGAPPVLLQHGLLDSSFTWVNNLRDESLAYLLADAGPKEGKSGRRACGLWG